MNKKYGLLIALLVIIGVKNKDIRAQEMQPAGQATVIASSNKLNSKQENIHFKSIGGNWQYNVYEKANGKGLDENFEIYDIVSHPKGYVLFITNAIDSKNQVLFLNIDFKLIKTLDIEKINTNSGKYLVRGDKIYYTNVSAAVLLGQEENRSYIIDINKQVITSFKYDIKRFIPSEKDIYYLNFTNEVCKLTDSNDLSKGGNVITTLELGEVVDLRIDKNEQLWVIGFENGLNLFERLYGRKETPVKVLQLNLATKDITKFESKSKYTKLSPLTLNKKTNELISVATGTKEKVIYKIEYDGGNINMDPLKILPMFPITNEKETKICSLRNGGIWVYGERRRATTVDDITGNTFYYTDKAYNHVAEPLEAKLIGKGLHDIDRSLINQAFLVDYWAKNEVSTAIKNPLNNNTIELYPNPATDRVFIKTKTPNEPLKVDIYNLQGQLLKSTNTISGQAVTLSEFKRGIYIIQIQDSERKTKVFKIRKV